MEPYTQAYLWSFHLSNLSLIKLNFSKFSVFLHTYCHILSHMSHMIKFYSRLALGLVYFRTFRAVLTAYSHLSVNETMMIEGQISKNKCNSWVVFPVPWREALLGDHFGSSLLIDQKFCTNEGAHQGLVHRSSPNARYTYGYFKI